MSLLVYSYWKILEWSRTKSIKQNYENYEFKHNIRPVLMAHPTMADKC